jgi:hypothetical protein
MQAEDTNLDQNAGHLFKQIHFIELSCNFYQGVHNLSYSCTIHPALEVRRRLCIPLLNNETC